MVHSADSEQPGDSAAGIQILLAHEAVRKRPTMYLGSTNLQALSRLLQLAVKGVLWHYRFLGETPEQITVQIASDSSATVTSSKAAAASVFLEQSARLLREECSRLWITQLRPFLHLQGVNAMSELCVVNALSDHLEVGIRGLENRWCSFQFEQGVFLHEEELPSLLDQERNIQLRFCPDFTILDPATFDYEQIQEAMHSLSKDFPSVPLTVIDAR
ncbi:hypothetical protein EPA93_27785 [Ktedonosporobacter rubrisoli]|uniref:DNA topoisomerase (ATP-hydrolyzing) n=1 Tax=Ktedonosporobacter rubrisoli TaxID=2509675 RepID=A0A4P6JW04_KTERU|nr:hypothetical protein [Ktedonosporobacter rubrisoli]QBD79573.1 hypothetical protein EPA93_27785 [Ktedonosporobacter rubrisoli]